MDSEDPVANDPMMRIVRERHPDVNIVLLPPVESIRDRPSATPAQCRALERHADTVLATISLNVEHEPGTRVDYWWSQGHPEVRRWVTAASYVDLGDRGAVSLLRALGALLSRLGWEPRPAADGSPRIRGVAGPFELIASAAADALSITITSDPVYVPAELYDALRAGA